MGCAGSGEVPKMGDKNTVQLLILGISGSGKTTFSKQMKILHCNGFQDFEVDNFRKIIFRNISSGLHELLLRLSDSGGKLTNEENENAATQIEENPSFTLTPENIKNVKDLWSDKSLKKIWRQNINSMHNSHLDYYIQHIDRISQDDYSPSNEDVVRCRQYTIGASTTAYFYGKLWWKLIDVGGQAPERTKWHVIVKENNISAVLYFVSMDEFDVKSELDEDLTKLELSLKVWKDVVESGDFIGNCTLLFFNKMDLFEELIQVKKKWKSFKKKI